MREPDVVLGDPSAPYLKRWWVIPRNRWLNIYLHRILRSDDDRALHDHPWWSISIILRGQYVEVMPADVPYVDDPFTGEREFLHRRAVRRSGAVVFRRAEQAHRLEVMQPVWTLFITGPRVRDWGFHCQKGWVLWRDYVDARDNGRVGRGCGEA